MDDDKSREINANNTSALSQTTDTLSRAAVAQHWCFACWVDVVTVVPCQLSAGAYCLECEEGDPERNLRLESLRSARLFSYSPREPKIVRVNKHRLRPHICFTAVIEEAPDVATLARVDLLVSSWSEAPEATGSLSLLLPPRLLEMD